MNQFLLLMTLFTAIIIFIYFIYIFFTLPPTKEEKLKAQWERI